MNINHVAQWAEENRNSPGIVGIVAVFVLSVVDSPSMPADKLAAIQRSFEPIDDAGTLNMTVDRHDVERLLREVLRLRAGEMIVRPEFIETLWPAMKGVEECPAPTVPAAAENAASSEPASMAATESSTSDADGAAIARPEYRSDVLP